MGGRLEGKVALITGGGQGIGRASALIFAREGARVVISEIDRAHGAAVVQDIVAAGGDAVFVQTDVRDGASVAESFLALDSRFGRIDVLYNCAGGSQSADTDVANLSLDVFRQTMALDVGSLILNSGEAVRRMEAQGGGVIINMSSYLAFRSTNDAHAYIAAKAAVSALTRSMAGMYSSRGIRVNAIAPARALTERAVRREAEPNVARSERAIRWDGYPFATGQPEDVGKIALFLASDESRMITGQTIIADGGITSF